MNKSGELSSVEQVLGGPPSRFQSIGAILKKAISWAGLGVLSDSFAETELPVEEQLVVIPVLQVCGLVPFFLETVPCF